MPFFFAMICCIPLCQEHNDQKSLEALENEAFEALQSRKSKGMKRPAASKVPAATMDKKPAGTAAAKKPATKAAAPKKSCKLVANKHIKKPKNGGPYGCMRCRGNQQGCSSCWQPNFAGIRLPPRQACLHEIQRQEMLSHI